MTLDEAVLAVEATLDSPHLRVDRRLARQDADAFLLLVLDTSNGRVDGLRPISNGPRLVDKRTGEVTRLTVPAAVHRAEQMIIVPAPAALILDDPGIRAACERPRTLSR